MFGFELPERSSADALATQLAGLGSGRLWAFSLDSRFRKLAGNGAILATGRPRKWSVPANLATETVDLLKASKAGELNVVARGQGQDRVRLTDPQHVEQAARTWYFQRGSWRRAPPDRDRGEARDRGFRAWGWECSRTGQAASDSSVVTEARKNGRPVGLASSSLVPFVTVPTGESLDVSVTAVCLNFGVDLPRLHVTASLFWTSMITAPIAEWPSRYAAYACSARARVSPRP